MIIDFIVDGQYTCGIRIFEDIVPNTAAELGRAAAHDHQAPACDGWSATSCSPYCRS